VPVIRKVLIIASCIFSLLAFAPPLLEKRTKIAIIDTGLMTNFDNLSNYLCAYGHYNFVNDNYDIYDIHGHGTNIAWLITRHVDSKRYCLLIYKYYDSSGIGYNNLQNEIKSFRAAIRNGAKYINLSGGGTEPAVAEENEIRDALAHGIRVVVAAGNNGQTICTLGKYYPACYKTNSPNFYAIGNCLHGKFWSSSNHGPDVHYCENGIHQGPEKIRMSGTSQSTAIFMNHLILMEGER
jgi:hypothetical protein